MAAAELALGLLDGEERSRRAAPPAGRSRLCYRGRDVARASRHNCSTCGPKWRCRAMTCSARVERSLDQCDGGAALISIAAPATAALGMADDDRAIEYRRGRIAAGAGDAACAPTGRPSHDGRSRPRRCRQRCWSRRLHAEHGGGAPMAAVYDPASGGMRVTAQAMADATAQRRIVGDRGATVCRIRSGVLPTGGGHDDSQQPPTAHALAAGATLAVSLEPIGGSPTGAPTGPVVAKGALSQV